MPYIIRGQCIEDTTQMLLRANELFPMVSSSTGTVAPQILTLTASSFVTTTGVYTFSTKNQANSVVNTNSTMSFPACTDGELLMPMQETIFICAFLLMFAIGLSVGLKP